MERRSAYPTDTQHMVNLSGYVWAAHQIGSLGNRRILDLSCGTGYGADYLGMGAGRIVGIDCVPSVVAKSRTDYPRGNVDFLAMDGCALGFRDESFDCIVSQDTIEHIQNDHRFVAELTRVLNLKAFSSFLRPMDRAGESFQVILTTFVNTQRMSSKRSWRRTFRPFVGTVAAKAGG